MTYRKRLRPPDAPAATRRLILSVTDENMRTVEKISRFSSWIKSYFWGVRVGLLPFLHYGETLIDRFTRVGLGVMVDTRQYVDHKETMATARWSSNHDVSMFTIHAAVGEQTLRAINEEMAGSKTRLLVSVNPFVQKANRMGDVFPTPTMLLMEHARMGLEVGCSGVVCSLPNLRVLQKHAPSFVAGDTVVDLVPLQNRKPKIDVSPLPGLAIRHGARYVIVDIEQMPGINRDSVEYDYMQVIHLIVRGIQAAREGMKD